jgi:hypothetical protein
VGGGAVAPPGDDPLRERAGKGPDEGVRGVHFRKDGAEDGEADRPSLRPEGKKGGDAEPDQAPEGDMRRKPHTRSPLDRDWGREAMEDPRILAACRTSEAIAGKGSPGAQPLFILPDRPHSPATLPSFAPAMAQA